MSPQKIVVLSGAGLSPPSGLATFRDAGGLWQKYRIEDVATPEAWARQPEGVPPPKKGAICLTQQEIELADGLGESL